MVSSLLGLIPELYIQSAIFSTCDIFEFVSRYPHGCVPVSSLLHTITRCKWAISYRHISPFREKRLYRAIFVIYAHDIIMHDIVTPAGAYRSASIYH